VHPFFSSPAFHPRIAAALLLAALFVPAHVHAASEFFSIADESAIFYDAYSLKATKLYVASRYLPVEAVVNIEGWVKVRDSGGSLAWVEKKHLSEARYVIVTAALAEVRQQAGEGAPLLFRAEKNVVMEWLEPASAGWVKVRHPDGTGYVKINQVWGA